MKTLMIRFVMLLSLLTVNKTFCWYLNIINDTQETVQIKLYWTLGEPKAAKEEGFALPPGHSTRINAGQYKLLAAKAGQFSYRAFLARLDDQGGLRIVKGPRHRGFVDIITNAEWLNTLSPQEKQKLVNVEGSPQVGTFWQKTPQ